MRRRQGIFLTPAWLLTYLSAQGEIPYGKARAHARPTACPPIFGGVTLATDTFPNNVMPFNQQVIVQVIETILAPLVVGQVIQYVFPDQVKKAQKYINFNKVRGFTDSPPSWAQLSDGHA